MAREQVIVENDVVIGNVYNKYNNKNPIVNFLMNGFLSSFDNLLETAIRTHSIKSAHEVGCGEGHLSCQLAEQNLTVRASDFSQKIIKTAEEQYSSISNLDFLVRSVYELDPAQDSADLIVCCEVLEHLEHPTDALEKLAACCEKAAILSVPREPLWRVLNAARGKYLRDLGNTPGHLQHWSKNRFIATVSKYFKVKEVLSPLPWTMLLAEKK